MSSSQKCSKSEKKVGDGNAVGTGGQQSPAGGGVSDNEGQCYTEDKELLAEAVSLEETTRSKDPKSTNIQVQT